jgi:hypothetical protein
VDSGHEYPHIPVSLKTATRAAASPRYKAFWNLDIWSPRFVAMPCIIPSFLLLPVIR